MTNEFSNATQDELRQGALDQLRGTGARPAETDPKVLEAEARQTAADKLRVDYILMLPADRVSGEEQAFLRAQINATLKTL